MSHPPVLHDTFTIERTFSAPPARVFAALADPAKKRRWYADAGETHDVESFEMEFRVGGQERAFYRFKEGSPFPGTPFRAEGTFLDIVPEQRVVIAATMTIGDRCISAALVTFEIVPSNQGTNLLFTHQAAFFEGADGPKMRLMGWQKLLDQLTEEVGR